MRIAYLVSQYPAVNHTFILREIRSLRGEGFQIGVFSIRPPDRAPEAMTEEEREEFRSTRYVKSAPLAEILWAHGATLLSRPGGYLRGLVHALGTGRVSRGGILAHLFYFAEAVVAGRWMMTGGWRLFHTHFSSTVGLTITRIFPLPMSMTIHGSGEFDDVAEFQMAAKVAASELVVAISSYGRSQILRACQTEDWDKVVVQRLGVDIARFTARPEPEGGSPEILAVGLLAPAKGQRLILEAIARVRGQGGRCRLRLVGDGPDRNGLEIRAVDLELAQDVIFSGWRNQDDVIQFYRQAAIFVLASLAEGIPVALMEAMAMEIPCVATRIMGIPELIDDGESGLLVAPADPEQLAESLVKLLCDAALRRRLGQAARRRIVSSYDLRVNCTGLAATFRARLGGAMEPRTARAPGTSPVAGD